jgi:hAT family C-terminal dimerisation region
MAFQSEAFSQATDPHGCLELPSQIDLSEPASSSRLSLPRPVSPSGCSATVKDWDAVPQHLRDNWVLSTRTGIATGWFWAHGYDVHGRTRSSSSSSSVWLCHHCIKQKVPKPKAYVSSNSRNIESHLGKAHGLFNPDPSKAERYVPELPLAQRTIHDFTAKKRKKDDFHDELLVRFDKTTFQRLLIQWIADANLPFRISEHKGLRKIFHYLNPLVEETSANLTHESIRSRIVNEFNTYKAHVIETLLRSPSQVHIAFDGWTSRNRHSFFSINAFFLDEETFQPRKVVLGLPNLTMAHTGENIAEAVAEILDDFELVAHKKVGCLILDNASNNDRAVDALGHKFRWQNPLGRRIRCFGHILHLVAKALLSINDGDAFEEDLDPDDFSEWIKRGPVGRLHNLVVWVNRSNKVTGILRKLQEDDPDKNYPGTLDVILDNDTRWLSQYHMIERALKLRGYLEDLIHETVRSSSKGSRSRSKCTEIRSPLPPCLDEDNRLTDADWDALGWFRDILAMFDFCLRRLQGDGQVRLHKRGMEAQYGIIWQVAIAYEFLLTTLEKAKAEAVDRPEPSYYASCINSAWTKLNKYYTKLDETPIYYAATVLHPGIQWTFLTKAYGEKSGWLQTARRLVQTLWDEEYRDLSALWEIASSNLPAAVRARELNPFDSFQDELMSSTNYDEELVADEFERWLSTTQDVYTKHDNPLDYWSAKRFEYPRVARMAIDVLSVPAMAAECERTFSSAGSMVSPKRSRLDASTIAVTQTVRSWLRAGLLEGYNGLLTELTEGVAEAVV